ncbi:restriction endonuclease [Streptomyces sp. SM14]|uniref:restriction endonuclease n=1 Tax=Streptomyces sp. SM14 TaxID=1736045 RepID=UPI0011B06945|nr:restriction endonuclease [Streptomyces sp. SM14]
MINIKTGDELKRSKIHDQYGGSRQGGISPSGKVDAIFLFTDPDRGAKHGYKDGWGEDGYYHYCGQGTTGDHTLTSNNEALLDHKATGRSVYLFKTTKRSFVYLIGEFTVAEKLPFYYTEGKGGNDEMRQMIVFRLAPHTGAVPPSGLTIEKPTWLPPLPTTCEYVPLEQHLTEEYAVTSKAAPRTARRTEAQLVLAYKQHLTEQGHLVARAKIRISGEPHVLFTDIYDRTDNVLIEAKGSTTRESARLAVGQLLDYSRHMPENPRLAALFPTQPRSDLRDFCAATNIATIWRDGKNFDCHPPASW